MGFDIQPDEFVQILNNGNHWLTVSTVGAAHPTVYDSIYSNAEPEIRALIASLLATTRGEIIANFIDVPFQSGCNDCGLFAIAYAVTIALGLRPEEYQFEQAGMRARMLRCWRHRKLRCSQCFATAELRMGWSEQCKGKSGGGKAGGVILSRTLGPPWSQPPSRRRQAGKKGSINPGGGGGHPILGSYRTPLVPTS